MADRSTGVPDGGRIRPASASAKAWWAASRRRAMGIALVGAIGCLGRAAVSGDRAIIWLVVIPFPLGLLLPRLLEPLQARRARSREKVSGAVFAGGAVLGDLARLSSQPATRRATEGVRIP